MVKRSPGLDPVFVFMLIEMSLQNWIPLLSSHLSCFCRGPWRWRLLVQHSSPGEASENCDARKTRQPDSLSLQVWLCCFWLDWYISSYSRWSSSFMLLLCTPLPLPISTQCRQFHQLHPLQSQQSHQSPPPTVSKRQRLYSYPSSFIDVPAAEIVSIQSLLLVHKCMFIWLFYTILIHRALVLNLWNCKQNFFTGKKQQQLCCYLQLAVICGNKNVASFLFFTPKYK